MTKPAAQRRREREFIAAQNDEDPLVALAAAVNPRTDLFIVAEYNPTTNRYDYLEQLEVEPVLAVGLEEFSRQRYGGGKYNWRQRSRAGKYGKSAVLSIGGLPTSRDFLRTDPQHVAGATVPAVASAAAGNGALLEKILVLLVGALAPVLAKKLLEDKSPDRMDDLLKLAAALKGNDSSAKQLGPIEILELMKKLEEFKGGLGAEHAPESTGSAVERIVEKAAVPVINLLERKLAMEEKIAERGAQRHAGHVSSPSASSSTSAAAEDLDALPLEQLLLRIPREARAFLLQCAKTDKSPELYAELTLDRLDDAMYRALAREIQRADALDVLLATVPAYREHGEWFAYFVDALRASLSRGTSETEAPGGGAEQSGNDSTTSREPAA